MLPHKEYIMLEIRLKDKPLFQATLEDFWRAGIEMGIIGAKNGHHSYDCDENEKRPWLILGIKALAQELGISVASVNRLISQGTIDSAIFQSGKLVWFDLREVLRILKKSK